MTAVPTAAGEDKLTAAPEEDKLTAAVSPVEVKLTAAAPGEAARLTAALPGEVRLAAAAATAVDKLTAAAAEETAKLTAAILPPPGDDRLTAVPAEGEAAARLTGDVEADRLMGCWWWEVTTVVEGDVAGPWHLGDNISLKSCNENLFTFYPLCFEFW